MTDNLILILRLDNKAVLLLNYINIGNSFAGCPMWKDFTAGIFTKKKKKRSKMKDGKGKKLSGLVSLYNHLNQFGSTCKAAPGLAWQMTALWVTSKTFMRGILISFCARQSW